MSVPNQTPYNIYTANGLTTVFAYEFYLINAGDIQVTINGAEITGGYSVGGLGNLGGGEITFLTPPVNGATVMLERVVPAYRLTDYQDNGDLLADTINKDFDRLWMAIQRYGIHLGLALRRPLFGGPFNAEGYRIEKLADPVNDQDAATKKYVESVSLARALRVPEASVGLAPSLDLRRNKLLAFNNSGDPITVLPESGSAADVLIELAKATGSSLVGYKYPADGSVPRTVQDKLDDFVFLEDFGGKDDNGVTDNSLAFQKAFASGVRKIYLKGSGIYGMSTRDIELPSRYEIIGNAKKPELKYFGSDTSFTMFTLTGDGPVANQWKQGGMMRDVVIASDVQINWIIGRHVQNIDFDRVFFYNVKTVMNNYHYVNFLRCERWGSPFYGTADLNTDTFISESPKFLMCFSSNSPIDALDTADLSIIGCTFFAGDYSVRFKTTLLTPASPDQFVGYPIIISGSVFDAVKGKAWDLNDVAYAAITGNIVSAGRTNNDHGAVIKGSRASSIFGNVFTYCGNSGLSISNAEQYSLSGNTFNGNRVAGLSIDNCKEISINGGAFGTAYVRGGYYTQPIGITDPANNCTGITISGISFDSDMPTKISLDTNEAKNNRVIGCLGVKDTQITYQNRGATAARPTNPVNGQMYYDVTLGLPIWWNAVTSTWKRADGTNA